jgi:hypothetical protein
MDVTRKIIGIFIIVFFGLPLLFGITWAVGIIRASLSPEFATELPQKIIAELPDTADEIFRAARDEEWVRDSNTRAWFRAMAETGISPKDVLEKSGVMSWVRGELAESLEQVGMVLRGERRAAPISLNFRPLKASLLSPEIERFIEATVERLPPCDERDSRSWAEIAAHPRGVRELPACRPDSAGDRTAAFEAWTVAVRDMDDETEIFEGIEGMPRLPFGFARSVTYASYFLFLLPAVFIFLGAVIADSSPRGFLQWSGGSILAGGVPTLILALVARSFSLWAIRDGAMSWNPRWTSDLGVLALDKLRIIPESIIRMLLNPVVTAAAVVCVLGIVLLALSSTARGKARPAPAAPQPSIPGPTAPPNLPAPPVPPSAT